MSPDGLASPRGAAACGSGPGPTSMLSAASSVHMLDSQRIAVSGSVREADRVAERTDRLRAKEARVVNVICATKPLFSFAGPSRSSRSGPSSSP